MKKNLLFTALGIIFALCLQGQNFVQVNKSNSGQVIQLSQDQVLEIQLPRMAATGYTWCETNITPEKIAQRSISQIGDCDFIHDPIPAELANSKGRMVGRSGNQIIRYTCTSQGTTTLTFELKRQWVKNGLPIDNFTITIVSAGKYTGKYMPPAKVVNKYDKPLTSTNSTLPSKWDWRSQCTPITNQYQCGDCWAFASVATLECNIKIHDGVTRDISEEFVTNCYKGNSSSGCNGGNCAHQCWLASYTTSNSKGGGAVYETDDPWTSTEGNGTTGTCSSSGYTPHETIDSYHDIGGQNNNGVPPVDSIKTHIYNHGPIWIAVDAASNGWNNYSGGIWVESGTSTDHAVSLVGWCDTTVSDGSGGYWILRNSWDTDWGVAGYMYISYGSDAVGCDADYIVYKGGISHAVAPVASFAASTTSSCTGVIQFTDASTNSPTSWAWTFGDGGTSTSQSPSHTYTTSGTFTVTLKATNAYGNNTATQTNYITINLPTAPTVTNGTANQGSSVTLTASGSGTLNWYNAASGGTLVNTGASYLISSLNSNETFYVENDVSTAAQSAGMSAKGTTGGYYTSTARQGLIFNALTDITLNSVTVNANTTASRTIFLKNSSGTEIDSITTSISSGVQTVNLGWSIPAGTGYTLGCSSNNSLWRETSGASYPYTATGLVSITGNTAGSSYPGYYYYFYNWQVAGASCKSARTPVTATILTGINEYSQANIELYPNPNNGEFTIAINNISESYKMTIINSIGQEVYSESISNINYKKTFDFKNLSKGIYSLRLSGKNDVIYKKMIIQ